jgi:hypothetical protein
VVIAGMVVRSIYGKASRTGVLKPYVYPLTLVMIASTYSLYTLHRFRFVYDFPSLALFSSALYLLYFRRSRLLFAAVFMVATINRETSLFLIIFCVLVNPANNSSPAAGKWRHWLEHARLPLTVPLLAFWISWHCWISYHFVHNASESWSRFWLNVGILLWPTSWVQILSTFAFCGPTVLIFRREIVDQTLRAWQWTLPVWIIFMAHYGIFVEVRIFGELIPYMAVMTGLMAEEHIVRSYQKSLELAHGVALPTV